MNTLIHANIFFFISSIGFIVIFILIAVGVIYLIRLLKKIDALASKLKEEAKNLSESAETIIDDIRESPIFGLVVGRKRRSKKTAARKE